jgi:hypothetical protein
MSNLRIVLNLLKFILRVGYLRGTTTFSITTLRIMLLSIITFSKNDLFETQHHRFERITRYNLGLASIGNSLEIVGSYAINS